jgi:hypothetical protein
MKEKNERRRMNPSLDFIYEAEHSINPIMEALTGRLAIP